MFEKIMNVKIKYLLSHQAIFISKTFYCSYYIIEYADSNIIWFEIRIDTHKNICSTMIMHSSKLKSMQIRKIYVCEK